MIKSRSTLKTLEEFLQKARRRLSDENPDYSDMDDEQDPDGLDSELSEDDDDEAAKWLESHEKEINAPVEEDATESNENEDPMAGVDPRYLSPKKYTSGVRGTTAKEQTSQEFTKEPDEKASKEKTPPKVKPPVVRSTSEETNPVSDDLQPSKEELAQLREYTRPWEQNARDRSKLEAEAHVNPIKHHQGRLVEARNTSHGDRQKAYEEYTKSPDFQNADPITQMEMESKFHDDWHKQNPEHLKTALLNHHEAHKKGASAMQAYNQVKDEKIRHIAGGGNNADAMSVEEGMQHVGGSRDDEDSGPSGIQQDKGAAFAAGNQEFVQQYMQNYDKKAKKFSNVADMDTMDPETRADVNTVLGDQPAFKDPAKKRQHDKFVDKYHPLIGKAARHVLSKLGLTDKANRGEIDHGMLHEAGMHALYQAINDYDHDHPSKAKFTTHLNRKLHGLMQTALKTAQTEVPEAMRAGAKKFEKEKRMENMSPVKHTNKEGVTTIIQPPTPPKRSVQEIAANHSPDVQDRLKRVSTARAPVVRKQGALQPKPPAPKFNVSNQDGEE